MSFLTSPLHWHTSFLIFGCSPPSPFLDNVVYEWPQIDLIITITFNYIVKSKIIWEWGIDSPGLSSLKSVYTGCIKRWKEKLGLLLQDFNNATVRTTCSMFIYGIDLLMAPKCLRNTGVDLWWFWHHHEQQTIDRPPFVQIPPKTAFINQKRMLAIVRTCLEFLWRCWLQRCAQNRWFWHLNLTRFVCQSFNTITISNWIDSPFFIRVLVDWWRSRGRGHFLRSRKPSM